MQRSSRPVVVGTVVLVATAILSGCASGGSTDVTPSATATTTVTATPSSAASSSASSSASTAPGTGATGTDGGAGTTGARCATSALAGSIEPGSGGAAGSVVVHLVLTNTGTATCTLQGWPGVSFVGGGDGAQIGAAASQDRSAPHPTVTLAPGQAAVAPLKIGQAGDYSSADCGPRTPDGFRVYPPGSEQSLFVRDTSYQGCAASSATLLSVQALVPPGQATS